MGKSYNKDVRAVQLGMPFGTACNRLRKQILFKYVKLCDDDICFKCGDKIETIEELSIEHKVPWLHNSPDLFWDLDNVAFSHIKCNRPHNNSGGWTKEHHNHLDKRGNCPPGKAWCSVCGYQYEEMFHKNCTKPNGLNSECKLHRHR